jgi:hypothetical protein
VRDGKNDNRCAALAILDREQDDSRAVFPSFGATASIFPMPKI